MCIILTLWYYVGHTYTMRGGRPMNSHGRPMYPQVNVNVFIHGLVRPLGFLVRTASYVFTFWVEVSVQLCRYVFFVLFHHLCGEFPIIYERRKTSAIAPGLLEEIPYVKQILLVGGHVEERWSLSAVLQQFLTVKMFSTRGQQGPFFKADVMYKCFVIVSTK